VAGLLARRPEGIFVNPFERGEIRPDLFRAAFNMGLDRRAAMTNAASRWAAQWVASC
jgi:hypothetical protein